jgi:hypothetical protein
MSRRKHEENTFIDCIHRPTPVPNKSGPFFFESRAAS